MKNNANRLSLFYSLFLLSCSSLFSAAQEKGEPLSQKNYKKYMRIIQQKDVNAYESMQAAEKKLGASCLITSRKDIKEPAIMIDQENPGYPTIVLSHSFFDLSLDKKERALISLTNRYKVIEDITKQEQEHVLGLITSLNKQVGSSMQIQDIERNYTGSIAQIRLSPAAALPILSIGKEFLDFPIDQQKFIIGHELGHYLLNNIYEDCSTFQESHEREYLSDSYSVLKLGASPEAAYALFSKYSKKEKAKISLSTHPLWKDRARRLEESLASQQKP